MPSGHSGADRCLALNVSLVVAADEDDGIGSNGGLPWRLPGDLKFFRRVTDGHPVVMGRRTFQSIGKPLPKRTNIVVTRDLDFSVPHGACRMPSLVSALALAAYAPGGDEIMVIGGADLFRQALSHARRIYLTRVHDRFPADTFLPSIDWDQWRRVWREYHPADPEHPSAHTFMQLERVIRSPTGS